MRLIRAACVAIVVAMSGALAQAEDPAKPAPAPAPAEAATFETAPARADEVLAGVRIVDGLRCASRAAQEFYVDPGFVGSLDAPPLRKAFQSFEGAGGAAGSVLVFEYAGAVPSFMRRVLAQSLWGGGGRNAERPDEIVVQGRLLWIVSFPYGDATAEWVKDRLRKRFRVAARRTRADRAAAEQTLWDLSERGDPKAGLAALDRCGIDVADWSVGSYLRGEFAMGTKDWAAAETAYRRAANLHAALVDPLPENLAWAAYDGVGNALFEQKKYDEAAKVLAKSKADGRALRLENDDTPHTAYALACALAQLGKWDDALRELTDAVDRDARWFKAALKDESLAEARKRPEFRVVLELDPPKPAPLPPKPPAPAKPAEAVTFDALLVKPAELPAGWTLVDGSQCVSTSAHSYFVTPDVARIVGRTPAGRSALEGMPTLPQPVRKSCQSIVRPDGTAGSVLTFEYAADVDPGLEAFLGSYFWGKDGPTSRYPEEILTQGHFLWIVSFPRGDAAGEWVKERLRKRFRIPALRTRPDLVPVMRRIAAAYEKHDADQGLRLLDARAALLADCSFAWYFRGEFGVGKSNPAMSETGYRRALELHDALADPLDEHVVWASLDGLGAALVMQKKSAEACTVLGRSKKFAADHGIKDVSGSSYNLACALAQLKKYDEALAELKTAIAAKASWKDSARDDADFAEARKRPDFQALLAK